MKAPRAIGPSEARMREFTCPTCQAVPPQPCRRRNGRPIADAHAARYSAAVAAGRLPIPDEEMT